MGDYNAYFADQFKSAGWVSLQTLEITGLILVGRGERI